MAPKALIVCLVLLSACAGPPPPQPQGPRAAWIEKTRAIQPSWGRKELEAFLDEIRVPCPHRPAVLNGGGFYRGSGPPTYFELFSLDETFALYVVWITGDPRYGIHSTEVVAFADLRRRIDPDLYEAVAAIHQSPSAERGIDFDPVRLIRASNALQALGREKA